VHVLVLAATATGVVVVLAAGYLGWCWLVPGYTCHACGGGGSRRTRILGRERTCRSCRGVGERPRLGMYVLRALREGSR